MYCFNSYFHFCKNYGIVIAILLGIILILTIVLTVLICNLVINKNRLEKLYEKSISALTKELNKTEVQFEKINELKQIVCQLAYLIELKS